MNDARAPGEPARPGNQSLMRSHWSSCNANLLLMRVYLNCWLPRPASTADDYEALLPWRLMPRD